MKKQLLFLLPVILAIASCNLFDNHGEEIKVGENEVFYKGENVTKEDAEKLGKFLTTIQWFSNEKPGSAQVTNDGGTYTVRLVADIDKVDSATRLNLWKLQYDLSKDVFNGKPSKIVFADDKLKEIESLSPVAKLEVGKGGIFYNSQAFKKEEVTQLATFLENMTYMGGDKEAEVLLNKEAGVPLVRLIFEKEVAQKNEETILPLLGYWQAVVQEEILKDQKAALLLTSVKYEDFKKIPAITAEEKQAFAEELSKMQQAGSQSPAAED